MSTTSSKCAVSAFSLSDFGVGAPGSQALGHVGIALEDLRLDVAHDLGGLTRRLGTWKEKLEQICRHL